jgi:hypothetical protein
MMNYHKVAKESAAKLGLDFAKLPYTIDDLATGIKTEAEEHSSTEATRGLDLNVVKGDELAIAKIALAHLSEREDYYDALEIVEAAPPGYWRNRERMFFERVNLAKLLLMVLLIIAIFLLPDYKWIIGGLSAAILIILPL